MLSLGEVTGTIRYDNTRIHAHAPCAIAKDKVVQPKKKGGINRIAKYGHAGGRVETNGESGRTLLVNIEQRSGAETSFDFQRCTVFSRNLVTRPWNG